MIGRVVVHQRREWISSATAATFTARWSPGGVIHEKDDGGRKACPHLQQVRVRR
jgi:hypothetical protein